jgi:hypothetical protein
VRDPELAGDDSRGSAVVEGLHQHRPVRRGQVLEGVAEELLVEDLAQPGIVRRVLGRRCRNCYRPGAGGPVGVGQQVTRDPEQPRPDRPGVCGELRQVPPRANKGLLNDVIGADLVRAEPLDVAMQGLGVVGVELADRGVGVAGQVAVGGIGVRSHIYYHE